VFFTRIADQVMKVHSNVVVQDIETPETICCRLNGPSNLVQVADVSRNADGVVASVTEVSRVIGYTATHVVGEDHAGSFVGQQPGGGFSDTSRRSGDDCHPVGEASGRGTCRHESS
jgi:hypothetical protein